MVSAFAKISSARPRKSRTRARSFRFGILRGAPRATLWEACYHKLGASRLTGVIFLAGLRLNLGLGRRGAPSRVRAGDRRNRQAPCRRWQEVEVMKCPVGTFLADLSHSLAAVTSPTQASQTALNEHFFCHTRRED